MKKLNQIKCPVCDGCGKIDAPLKLPHNLLEQKIKVAKTLSNEGFSVREIMRIMNYKSPRSVQYLLTKPVTI